MNVRTMAIAILAIAVILGPNLPVTSDSHDTARVRPEAPSSPVSADLAGMTPENTLILSNQSDRDFCQDFSVVLGNLAAEWQTLAGDENPESLPDKNILLVGRLDSDIAGALIGRLVTEEEAHDIRHPGGHAVVVRRNPSNGIRMLLIAAGADTVLTKAAAEEAVRQIMEQATTPSLWYRSAATASRDDIEAYFDQFRHQPGNDDLPIDALRMDVDAGRPRRVTAEEAAEDVEHLFSLLSHGWCGYGHFGAQADFDAVQKAIVREVRTEAHWSPDALSDLLREHLAFIHDCHMNIHGTSYCDHLDFWYDSELELRRAEDGYMFVSGGAEYRVATINGQAPAGFVYPSLNAQGKPIYRLGLLARSEPEPLQLAAESAAGGAEFEITLAHAEYLYRDRFGEERIGGVPVLRARSFADYYSAELGQFIEAAGTYGSEPYVIIDIRGNGGGSTDYPKGWITRFTGQTPSLKHVLTELISRTTMMGRANVYAEMLESYPDEDAAWIGAEMERYEASARDFDDPSAAAYWTPLQIPFVHFIPNDTTLIVLVDGGVASAGEGLLSYLHQQVENAVIVGENSMGAVTFGQVSTHRLPHSRLHVTLPIKLNAMMDMAWREEQGYLPDLWVPAGEALNYAVAAVRAGTIGTQSEIPAGYFDADFRPERVRKRNIVTENEHLIGAVGLMVLFGSLAMLFRKQKLLFFILGIGWVAAGAKLVATDSRFGRFLLPYGLMYVGVAASRWWRSRKAADAPALPTKEMGGGLP